MPRRLRLWLSAAMVAGWLPGIAAPLKGWYDFSAYYGAGRLAFQPSVMDPLTVVLWQATQNLPPDPFVSPPFVALAFLPYSWLPWQVAGAIHFVLMAGALVGGAVLWADALGIPRRWAVIGALAWSPASTTVISGQIDTVALLVTGALARAAAGRVGVGFGLLVSLLAFKPQITAGAGWAALRRFGPRSVVGLVVGAVVLYVLGAIAIGGDVAWPIRWLDSIRGWSTPEFDTNGWQSSSPVTLGMRLSIMLQSQIPLLVSAVVGIGIVALCLRGWRPQTPADDMAMWSALALILSPHIWTYNLTMMLPLVGLNVRLARERGWLAADRAVLVAAFAVTAAWPLAGVIRLSPDLLVVVGLPLWTALRQGVPEAFTAVETALE
jgi:hypothetical protein